jgi:hypothetical protein
VSWKIKTDDRRLKSTEMYFMRRAMRYNKGNEINNYKFNI